MKEAQAKLAAERKELEKVNSELLQGAEKILKKQSHPVLGELLVDMGHKLIYRADPITLLAQASFWRKQRAYRPVNKRYTQTCHLSSYPSQCRLCLLVSASLQCGSPGPWLSHPSGLACCVGNDKPWLLALRHVLRRLGPRSSRIAIRVGLVQ